MASIINRAKGLFKKNIFKYLLIAGIATLIDWFAHENLNPFFADDTTRPWWYYAIKIVAFVIAFLFVDLYYKSLEKTIPIKLSRARMYAIAGTVYFGVYYIFVAPAFILTQSATILTLLHAVFILVGVRLTRLAGVR